MNHNLKISQSILINAPMEKVWEGLTNPEIIKEYLFGTETITDWKVGSEIIFQGNFDGFEYKDHGKIIEYVLHEKIAYSYWTGFAGLEDLPENYAKVSYLVKSIDENSTEFTWVQEGFANEEGYEHSKEGMEEFLLGIKRSIDS